MPKKRRVKLVTQAERDIIHKRIDETGKHRLKDDPQIERVYKWQSESLQFGNVCDWTLLECQRFISYVWHSYFGNRARPPKVDPGRGHLAASANRWVVHLPVWARNRNIILHELAHCLLDATNKPDKEGHGSRFVRLQIELLTSFSTHSRNFMMETARAAGVKVARRDAVIKRRACESTISKCRTKHYHSMGEDLDDWMKKGSPRIVHVKGKAYRAR